jgi:hypothetical protein
VKDRFLRPCRVRRVEWRGEIQFVFGARDADVKEAALFFHLFGIVERTAVRNDAVVETDDEDRAEFESLGGVEGEQGGALVGDGVLIGDERDVLEKLVQRARGVFVARRFKFCTFSQRSALSSDWSSTMYSL